MAELLLDALLDTLKLLPYLFLTFLILEFVEHKLSQKAQKSLIKYQKLGPLIGGTLGGFPQCGFSAMSANLYASKVITMGTLISVFLSTSDEMLPIMLGENAPLSLITGIIGFKILVGISIGFIVDFISKNKPENNHIKELCTEEHCHCEKDGIFLSSLKHTGKTLVFILLANIFITFLINLIDPAALSRLLENPNILVHFIASLIGLIPNCASSVILTKFYLSDIISLGVALSGLLASSGVGILLLFKSNKNFKENLTILSITYLSSVLIGFLVDLFL